MCAFSWARQTFIKLHKMSTVWLSAHCTVQCTYVNRNARDANSHFHLLKLINIFILHVCNAWCMCLLNACKAARNWMSFSLMRSITSRKRNPLNTPLDFSHLIVVNHAMPCRIQSDRKSEPELHKEKPFHPLNSSYSISCSCNCVIRSRILCDGKWHYYLHKLLFFGRNEWRQKFRNQRPKWIRK